MSKSLLTDPFSWRGFDVETYGGPEGPLFALQPWSPYGHMFSFGHSWYQLEDGTHKIRGSATIKLDQLPAWLDSVIAEGSPIIGWNVAFDAAWLIAAGYREQVMQIDWLDGMLLWRHLWREPTFKRHPQIESYGLKAAVARYRPRYADYAAEIDLSDILTVEKEKVLRYNALDAKLTLSLARELFTKLQLTSQRQVRCWLTECKSIPLVADHYITGLHVDLQHLGKLHNKLLEERVELFNDLRENDGISETVLSSPVQLRELLYSQMGLPIMGTTPKGAASTDREALHELAHLSPVAAKISRVRELGNLRTKFVDKIIESCEHNDCNITHPTMSISSTYTGRATFSSSVGKGAKKHQTGFAVHQMKRSDLFRNAIKAPDGFDIVEWDAAGQEYRWMAVESGDPTMLSLCEPGEDPHAYMGAAMSEFEYRQLIREVQEANKAAENARQSGKVGNLSCQYRISPKRLLGTARVQYNMPWDIQKAKQVHSTYHSVYPYVRRYWDRQVRFARNNGYVETLAGRRVQLRGTWTGDEQWSLESTAINFPIQGVGADQKYLAIACIKPLLAKYGGKFYFELHDGLYCVFPKKVAVQAALAGKRLLDNLPYKRAWGFEPPIPLPWDIKVGPKWGSMKKM
jgi:DNA polymerase-1